MTDASSSPCANCSQPCEKPLRCGICKVQTYCSAQCQKEDWRFHKRNCKKPEESKPAKDPGIDLMKSGESEASKNLEEEMSKLDPAMRAQMESMMKGMLGGDSDKKEEKPEVPKVMCRNCSGECIKILKCGVCKDATYCSAQCQKEDWKFHKRICKKPEPKAGYPSPKQESASSQSAATEAAVPARPKDENQTEVVAGEDMGKWYNHREYKPKEEKKDFTPERLDREVGNADPKKGSQWNTAGTWEEKNMVSWWQDKLKALGAFRIEGFAGTSKILKVERMGAVAGEAAITHIRGTPRFFFDLKFGIEYSLAYKTSSSSKKGALNILEFSNAVDESGEFVLSTEALPSQGSVDEKKDVEDDLVPRLRDFLGKLVTEYEGLVEKPVKAHPGQLPPKQ
eukprot:gnl/MRDRNA2_/MRDRNA2_95236_c0_seq1.p1 gnl/MRDRNA2_/MRDRNA2_95236_c0~~gnl/MRDRNA2_/MRDRNA2_95236_c0_seq1.p1  ORF type:complete len:396 (+),score=107.34 gnl/MRDRNA2_/MRDRNA2_95236_c0_seq1:53-1240(+)